MPSSVTVPHPDDIDTNEDYARFLERFRRLVTVLSTLLALAAATIKAMLRETDKRSGRRRAAYVARPLGLAAMVMLWVAKYLAMADRRFREHYAAEIAASKKKPGRREMRFQ